MMNLIIIISLIVVGVVVGGIFLFLYENGHFTITSNEEVERATYAITHKDFSGNEIPSGKITRIVYKITYASGRMKYVTQEYKH